MTDGILSDLYDMTQDTGHSLIAPLKEVFNCTQPLYYSQDLLRIFRRNTDHPPGEKIVATPAQIKQADAMIDGIYTCRGGTVPDWALAMKERATARALKDIKKDHHAPKSTVESLEAGLREVKYARERAAHQRYLRKYSM